jgi:broad specificity phosphatase PhoE
MAKLLLIRHAERPDIPANTVGNDVLLTDKGKADTRIFARSISEPVVSIQSSPIGRCMETAEIIADVVGFDRGDVVINRDLGDPGYIIQDGREAWKHWQSKGSLEVNNHLLSGTSQWSGFHDLNLSTRHFLQKIVSQLVHGKEGVHVWLTHDTILATFASRVLPNYLNIDQWPNFLGCVSICLSNNKLMVDYYQGPGVEVVSGVLIGSVE